MEMSSPVTKPERAAPSVALLQAAHHTPDVPATLQSRRTVLENTFDKDRDTLLGIIESYLRRGGVTHGWQDTRETALDVYGELFIEAMRTLEKFDENRSPRAWLLSLASNLVLRKKVERAKEFSRASQNTEAAPGNEESAIEVFDRLAAASHHFHQLSSPLEKQQTLDEILSGVNEGEREILMLSVVHGLRSEIIGAQLGISAAAARKRLQRALEHLRADYLQRFATSESPSSPSSNEAKIQRSHI